MVCQCDDHLTTSMYDYNICIKLYMDPTQAWYVSDNNSFKSIVGACTKYNYIYTIRNMRGCDRMNGPYTQARFSTKVYECTAICLCIRAIA